MRYYASQLESALATPLAPVYVLHGSVPFLIEESARLIRTCILQLGDIEQTSLSQFEQRSLFSQKRFIEIKNAKLTPQELATLEDLLSQPLVDTYILLQMGQLSRAQQQAKWFLLAKEKGVEVPHWPLSAAQFLSWARQRAKKLNLKLSAEYLNLLIYQTEGNTLALAQEMDRLALYFAADNGDGCQQSQFEVFDLCEAALGGAPQRVVKIVSCLKNSETALQLIVWSLQKTLQVLLKGGSSSSSDNYRQLLQRAGIRHSSFEYYQQALKQATVAKMRQWAGLLSILAQTDKHVKTGDVSAAWRNILEISLRLCSI